jgi:magnesium-transporting ATPase (P-type)
MELYWYPYCVEFTTDCNTQNNIDFVTILCKGADSVIFSRLRPGALGTTETTQHINEFANLGLRTLCFAATVLEKDTYERWSAIYHEATLSVEHRAQRVDEAAEQIETHMTLLGAVGIEDRLQPDVPSCVASLQEAGIRVWVLTGDKTETAIAVATQASVLTQDMQIEILEEANEKALIRRLSTLSDQLSLIPPLSPYLRAIVGFLGLDPISLPPFLRPPPTSLALALVLTDVSLPIGKSL